MYVFVIMCCVCAVLRCKVANDFLKSYCTIVVAIFFNNKKQHNVTCVEACSVATWQPQASANWTWGAGLVQGLDIPTEGCEIGHDRHYNCWITRTSEEKPPLGIHW